MAQWHTSETLLTAWADAEQVEESVLLDLIEVAKEAIVAYAPSPAGTNNYGEWVEDDENPGIFYWSESELPFGEIPSSWRMAHLVHIKNLWNASRVSADGTTGLNGEFVIQPRPLDWHVKQILRPARAVPIVR
jgi:hypothetical protein